LLLIIYYWRLTIVSFYPRNPRNPRFMKKTGEKEKKTTKNGA